MVKVRFASHLGRELGVRETEVDVDSVRALLAELSRRYGAPFDLRAGLVTAIVNGTSVAFLKGKGTRLVDGDEVYLLPPVAGG